MPEASYRAFSKYNTKISREEAVLVIAPVVTAHGIRVATELIPSRLKTSGTIRPIASSRANMHTGRVNNQKR